MIPATSLFGGSDVDNVTLEGSSGFRTPNRYDREFSPWLLCNQQPRQQPGVLGGAETLKPECGGQWGGGGRVRAAGAGRRGERPRAGLLSLLCSDCSWIVSSWVQRQLSLEIPSRSPLFERLSLPLMRPGVIKLLYLDAIQA